MHHVLSFHHLLFLLACLIGFAMKDEGGEVMHVVLFLYIIHPVNLRQFSYARDSQLLNFNLLRKKFLTLCARCFSKGWNTIINSQTFIQYHKNYFNLQALPTLFSSFIPHNPSTDYPSAYCLSFIVSEKSSLPHSTTSCLSLYSCTPCDKSIIIVWNGVSLSHSILEKLLPQNSKNISGVVLKWRAKKFLIPQSILWGSK